MVEEPHNHLNLVFSTRVRIEMENFAKIDINKTDQNIYL